jgi:plastocyanin
VRAAAKGLRFGLAAIAAVCAAACGSSFTSSDNAAPAPSYLDSSQPRAAVPAVSITAAGFNPQVLHVDYPVTVTFTNADTVAHTLESAPELNWDNCPEMNTVGTLTPGQSKAVPFSEKDAVCAYHDAAQASRTAFQGYIAIHAP